MVTQPPPELEKLPPEERENKVFYHATSAENVSQILSQGIKPLAWLTRTREDSHVIVSDYRPETESVKVFRVELPRKWKLREGPGDEYISDTTIPPEYLRLVA